MKKSKTRCKYCDSTRNICKSGECRLCAAAANRKYIARDEEEYDEHTAQEKARERAAEEPRNGIKPLVTYDDVDEWT